MSDSPWEKPEAITETILVRIKFPNAYGHKVNIPPGLYAMEVEEVTRDKNTVTLKLTNKGSIMDTSKDD